MSRKVARSGPKWLVLVWLHLTLAAGSAATPEPVSNGSYWLVFKPRMAQCLPAELRLKLFALGYSIIATRASEGQLGECCPYGMQGPDIRVSEPAVWRQVAPFALQDEPYPLTIDRRCAMSSMSMADLPAAMAEYQAEEEQKRAEKEQERVAADRAHQERQAAQAQADAEARVREAQALQDQERRFVAEAPELDNIDVCVYYGLVLREQEIPELYQAPTSKIKAAVNSEFKKRKLSAHAMRVKDRELRLNDTTCHLYAAWGRPEQSNRSVNAYAVHVQHVFGRRYIYTVNDRITSWQD